MRKAKWRSAVLGLGFAGLALAAIATAAAAQDYPTASIRMVVPFAPGGGTDVLGRILAQRLQEKWGQAVIVENQPGASGGIGTKAVARADPDGYTLLMASTGALMADAAAFSSGDKFEVERAFAPVTLVAAPPYVIAINAKLPVNSVKELIALGRDKKGGLSFGSSGVGAASHLAGELFQKQAGIEMLHVPYKGTGQAVTDLVGGRIDVMFAPPQTVQPLIASGQLRAIATTGTARSPLFPDLPTVAESGLPDYKAVGWFGLLAPVHTPDAIVRKLNAASVAILDAQDVRARLAALGAVPQPQTPEEFARFINADLAVWMRVLREAEARQGAAKQ